VSVIPGLVAFLAAFVMRFYHLDEKQLLTIQQELDQRKTAPSIKPAVAGVSE
jgi:GPH family glycoside/pentoside/hexuronide:cation symporter